MRAPGCSAEHLLPRGERLNKSQLRVYCTGRFASEQGLPRYPQGCRSRRKASPKCRGGGAGAQRTGGGLRIFMRTKVAI